MPVKVIYLSQCLHSFIHNNLYIAIVAMMLKYTSVLQRYYIQYMSGFDNSLLKEILQVRNTVCYPQSHRISE